MKCERITQLISRRIFRESARVVGLEINSYDFFFLGGGGGKRIRHKNITIPNPREMIKSLNK